MRSNAWSVIEDVETGRVELYDRQRDPRELTNLAGRSQLAPTIADLRRVLSLTEEGTDFCDGAARGAPEADHEGFASRDSSGSSFDICAIELHVSRTRSSPTRPMMR